MRGFGDGVYGSTQIQSAACGVRAVDDTELHTQSKRWADVAALSGDGGCVIGSIQPIENAVRLAQSAKADFENRFLKSRLRGGARIAP